MQQQYDTTPDPHLADTIASAPDNHITEGAIGSVVVSASREAPEQAPALTAAPIIWTLAPDGALQDVSPEWDAYTGLRQKQASRREPLSVFESLDAIHPDDREPTLAALRRALAERRPYQSQCRLRRWDGIYQPFVMRATPLSTPDGCVRQWALALTNATAREKTVPEDHTILQRGEVNLGQATAQVALAPLEEDVAERARTLEVIFETMIDGIVLLGPTGEITMMNSGARRLLAFDEAELSLPLLQRGRTLDLRHPSTRAPLPQAEWPASRVLRGEALTGLESVDMLMLTRDGREALINCAGAPVHDEQGHISGAVLLVRDVGERRRLEREVTERAAELEVANRRLDEFLHVVAHELRTPLTSVMMSLQLVDRRLRHISPIERVGPQADTRTDSAAANDTPNPAPTAILSADVARAAREFLAHAQQQSGRMARLLDDLTDASRVRTGKLTLRPALCDLVTLVRDGVEDLRQTTKRIIRLQTPTVGAVSVVADTDRIGQVLTNYLTNAVKYSPRDRPITVSLTAKAGYARVAVRDQGPGLTADQQERIWERFYQVGDVGSDDAMRESAGLGLGLHISRSLIQAHGGAVGVESVVGEGCVFWFTLPLITPPQSPSQAPCATP